MTSRQRKLVSDEFPVFHWRHDARIMLILCNSLKRRTFIASHAHHRWLVLSASCETHCGAERDIREGGQRSKKELSLSAPIFSPIMKLTITLSVFLVLGSTNCIHAERSKSTTGTSNPVTRKLFIDPSSTSVRLGKATLIVSPLTRRGGNYIGDYQLKVRPISLRARQALWFWAHPRISFGGSSRGKRLILLVRLSRAKTAQLMWCLEGQLPYRVTGELSPFQL